MCTFPINNMLESDVSKNEIRPAVSFNLKGESKPTQDTFHRCSGEAKFEECCREFGESVCRLHSGSENLSGGIDQPSCQCESEKPPNPDPSSSLLGDLNSSRCRKYPILSKPIRRMNNCGQTRMPNTGHNSYHRYGSQEPSLRTQVHQMRSVRRQQCCSRHQMHQTEQFNRNTVQPSYCRLNSHRKPHVPYHYHHGQQSMPRYYGNWHSMPSDIHDHRTAHRMDDQTRPTRHCCQEEGNSCPTNYPPVMSGGNARMDYFEEPEPHSEHHCSSGSDTPIRQRRDQEAWFGSLPKPGAKSYRVGNDTGDINETCMPCECMYLNGSFRNSSADDNNQLLRCQKRPTHDNTMKWSLPQPSCGTQPGWQSGCRTCDVTHRESINCQTSSYQNSGFCHKNNDCDHGGY